ncbi:hypothetical protein ACHAXR_011909 [Thalassiosira sp. AJA248-18]
MKRVARALFVFFPRRNQFMVMDNKCHPHAAAAGMPRVISSSTTTAPNRAKALGGAVNTISTPPSKKSAENNNRYIVSRNGILLPWGQIHQRYRRVDDALGAATSNSPQQTSSQPRDLEVPLDSSTLLQLLPRGAYTTCRTVRGGTHIYQFDYHVRRLALSAQSILENISGEGSVEEDTKSAAPNKEKSKSSHRTPSKDEIYGLNIIDEAWEREMAMNCIRSTLDAFHSQYLTNIGSECDENLEFRISLLATWEKKEDADGEEQQQQGEQQAQVQSNNHKKPFQSVLYCHVGILPQSLNINSQSAQNTQRHIQVLIHGHGRENALAKDSKWVIDRKKLTMPEPSLSISNSFEEIILINDNGELLEGTQTNFYVVNNESIITADKGILHGSVRDSVLRVCRTHDIRVDLRPPTLDDLRQGSGVFITSTSRLVMPVHEVVLGDLQSLSVDQNEDGDGRDASSPSSYCYPNCLTTENIRKWVLEDVETHSTPVYNSVND